MSLAFAIGVGTKNQKNEWLEVFYAQPVFQPSETLLSAAKEALGYEGGNQAIEATSDNLEALASALSNQGETEQAAIASAAKAKTAPNAPPAIAMIQPSRLVTTAVAKPSIEVGGSGPRVRI